MGLHVLAQALAGRDSSPNGEHDDGPIARWILPRDLAEISGLTLTADGRLLAHDDESGRISQIDYRRGLIVKQFLVGRHVAEADFEAITLARDVLFLATGGAKLYEFREGANGARVDYVVHDTRLGRYCEVEGLAYDERIESLLLACKNVGVKEQRDSLVIYRWRIPSGGQRVSQLTIPLSRIKGSKELKELHPTDLAIDPNTGNYVLVAKERVIVEITPDGAVVAVRTLPDSHGQPEGLAITRDGLLIVGDEQAGTPAAVTLYHWR